MAISVVASTAVGANNPTAGNFALPGSWAANDLAIFWWYSRINTKTYVDASGGNITQVHNSVSTPGVLFIGYRVLQGGDVAANMDWTSGTITNASVAYGTLILRGTALTSPIEADSGAPANVNNTQSPDPPSVVVATAGACVITIFGKNNDYTTITAPASYTLGGSAEDTAGTDGSGGLAYRLNVSAGTENPGAWTLGGLSSDDCRIWTGSIKPLVGAEMAAAVTLALTVPPAALTTAITLASTVAVGITATADLTTPALGFGTASFGAYAFGHPGATGGGGAVTVVGTASQAEGASTPLTFSHTVPATATGLFVGIGYVSSNTISSVTFNGDALTALWLEAGGFGVKSAGYLMVTPDVTTGDVVVTMTGAPDVVWAGAVNLANLDASSLAAAHRTVYIDNQDGGSATPTITVVDSQAGDLVIDTVATYFGAITATQTSIVQDDAVVGSNIAAGISTASATGASTVMAWSGGGVSMWASGSMALVPSGGAAAAEMEAAVVVAITATAALTTAIELAAAPTLALTTAGQLTTAITMAATPTLSLTTAGALTTEIRLAAAASVAITTAAPLTTVIALAATPALVLTATADLTTEIRLAAASTLQITTAADLTAQAPLTLEGSAILTVTSTGALTTEIRMAGAASLAVTTSASLTTAIPLAAGVTAAVTAAGTLTTAITLAATPTVSITTSAALTAIPAGLGAEATLRITTAASLTTAIQMAGTAALAITTSGNLEVAAGLAGQATVQVTTAASLTTYTPLAGTASLTVHTTADLFAESPPMVGAATLTILTAADLATEIHLAGEALLVVLAQGMLGSIPPTIVNPSVRVIRPGRTTQPIPAGRAGVVTGAGRTVGNGAGARTATPVRSSRRTLEAIE